LANPQNLDIADLISNPRESPFAMALLSSPVMLVVPNHRGSIYCRLWCAYEAFLAYETDKVIQVASAPSATRSIWWACAGACVAGLCGILVGWRRLFFNEGRLTLAEHDLYWAAVTLPYLGSAILANSLARRTCHLVGAAALAFYAATAGMEDPYSKQEGGTAREAALSSILVCFFFLSEVDRARSEVASREADFLSQGYKGSIRHAACSVKSDAEDILSEIGSKSSEVDKAIQVLMRAGMWNRSLRAAAEAGVDVKGAAHMEFAMPLTSWAVQLVLLSFLLSFHDEVSRMLGLVNLILQLSWFALVAYLPQDRRAFGIKAMSKLSPLWALAAVLTHLMCCYALGVDSKALGLVRGQAAILIAFTVLGLSLLVAGVDRVARWPLCGRRLAELMLARRWCRCRDSSTNTEVRSEMSASGSEASDSTDSSGEP